MSTNINTLWTFGCSFTDSLIRLSQKKYGRGSEKIFGEYIDKFCDGKIPPSWPEILSTKMNYKLRNFGYGGASNYFILQSFLMNLRKIKKDDVVIIQWTDISRFRMSFKDGTNEFLVNITQGGYGKDDINKHISNVETIDNIFYNRMSYAWEKEIFEWNEFLTHLAYRIGFKLYFWTWTNLEQSRYFTIYKNSKKYWMSNILRKVQDTYRDDKYDKTKIQGHSNGEINDSHLSKIGHEILAETMYQHIEQQ